MKDDQDLDRCPECGEVLTDVSDIGECCFNDDCPVLDDALLWDGNGNRSKGPEIKIVSVPADDLFLSIASGQVDGSMTDQTRRCSSCGSMSCLGECK